MKKLMMCLTLLCLMAALAIPASALEYTIGAPGGAEYAKPTSVEPVVTAGRGETPNEDLSKNATLVPPTFGSPTSYVLGVGDPLTPNLTGAVANGLGGVISGGGASLLPPVSADTPHVSVPPSPKERATSRTPPSGRAMSAWLVTTVGPTATSVRSTPWTSGIRSP